MDQPAYVLKSTEAVLQPVNKNRKFFLGGKSERTASPFEIRFYEDYLVVYREKYYYGPRISRMEFNKFRYSDIDKCQYKAKTKRINIFGTIEAVWYDYQKDGTVPEQPTYQKKTKGGICYFYTNLAPETDFVKEIETHSPIKVMVDMI